MRDDLNASEKRLIAALDRIDHFLDRAAAAGAPAAEQLQQSGDENRRLTDELAQLRTRQGETHERLQEAGREAARLVAANEALAEANRALIAGTGAPADAARRALEAEIESLRAAHAAEEGQMQDILAALDRMLGTPAPAPVTAVADKDEDAVVEPETASPPRETAGQGVADGMPDDDEERG
ncbi:hypothetical protein SAMN04487972_101233 [Paracoccus halophilus]|uniref:Uncharacterized protein n=1 Tax=Paracoccus halophilus TaxID=376733 RepID=A0A099F6H2_9RHOB|nr:hypothetical protein [Paracoccus halophilus]KGJ06330.1 hypothetical protein IT41_01425 [Paracoccus halophilus]SFA39049.1 hypothetical protein SAMN04487972_101233 [Paracoccus halophilus]